jgi:predicted O-linked N-acetylglucosamine transferase (SPINDLY family)
MMSPETKLQEQLALAQTLQRQGRVAEARRLFEEIIGLQPDHCEALNDLGVLAGQTQDPQQACLYFDRVIAAQPNNFAAYCNRGLAEKQLRRFEAALASFDRAIALNDDDPIVHYSRAETYRELDRPDEALAGYDRAVAIDPAFVQVEVRRGTLLQQLGRLADAVASFDLALRRQPDHVDVHANRAVCLFLLRRYEEALAGYDQTLALRPDNAVIHVFRGIVLEDLNRREEAVAAYDRAIALDPDYAESYVERASVLHSFKRFDAAAADYRRAARLDPDLEFLAGMRLETSLQTCDWIELDAQLAQITAGVEGGRRVVEPSTLLGLADSPSLQLQAARIWVRKTCPANDALGPIPPRTRGSRLRIGYFSADFRECPNSRLLAELIETHDRARFEVLGFAFGPNAADDARQRLAAAFDQFIDVHQQSDREAASLARRIELDIAIDLGGYTHNSRPGIFALRAAPLQVSYLGYLGTLGADYIDYIVADRVVITPQSETQFTEKVVYLPDTFQVHDRRRRIADRIFTRAELGLPPVGFVFCCFEASYKILPATFASWMRILNRVPLSVLFLLSGEPALETNLRAYAARHRIDPRRLIFADRLPLPEYLARYRAADLFLDTLPHNAGATASDALWAGLPVLTLAGHSFAARIVASLLEAAGLQELVTTTREAYEDLAVALASDPLRLRQIRSKLLDAQLSGPLFDTQRFTRNLEAAFTTMQARYDAGLPADHIAV